jgi:DNA-binding transcriptional MerR regulator
MRISQLAAESGVSVPSIKFYLREGLLHDGVRTSATQAEYDGEHVRRLRLIRALLGPGGLTVAGAQSLLGTMEHPPEYAHDLLGAAHASAPAGKANRDDLDAVRAEAASWGWDVPGCDPLVLSALGDALQSLRDADFIVP